MYPTENTIPLRLITQTGQLHETITTTTTMRSHLFLAGAFTTAAAVALPPVYPPPSYNNTSPLSNAEFGLTMRIPGTNRTFAALVATKNGTQEELVLVARRLSVYTGTPAYVTNEQPKDSRGFDGVALNMDVNGTSYALSAADIVRTGAESSMRQKC